jgi:hypothetical protein
MTNPQIAAIDSFRMLFICFFRKLIIDFVQASIPPEVQVDLMARLRKAVFDIKHKVLYFFMCGNRPSKYWLRFKVNCGLCAHWNREPSIPIVKENYMTFDPKKHDLQSDSAHGNHLKAAEHCDAASAAHKEAAKHTELGDSKHAGYHAAVAQGHTLQASEHSDMACKKVAIAVKPQK